MARVAGRDQPQRRNTVRALWLVLGLWTLATLCRLALPTAGLFGQHFGNDRWSGEPFHAGLARGLSTDELRRNWAYLPPDMFTSRWVGYLIVSRPGRYSFTLTSDDGSLLYINGRVIVDNRGAHGALARGGAVDLNPGPHGVIVEYSQVGGPYTLEWTWARDDEPAEPIPVWRLSQRRSPLWALVAEWAAATVWPYLTLVLVVVGWRWAYARGYWPKAAPELGEWPPALTSPRALACLAFFVMLASVHTWPLVTDPAHLSRNDNADTVLNEWTMAWVAHQLPRRPFALFDANIFHPDRMALAYSEALILQGVLAAPLLWLGASPVLAYNVVLLAGLALTGWAMCLVVSRWTGEWTAGLASGTVLAFNAHTLTRLPHIQAQHAELMPIALLALDALLRRPGWRPALWLATAIALQGLASIYLLVFTIVAIGAAVLTRPEDWAVTHTRRSIVYLVAAAAAAALVVLPLLWPYWRLRQAGFTRSIDEQAWFAASLRDYVTTPARWYPWAGGEVALFAGSVALVLAGVAIVTGVALRDARARMCLGAGVAGMLLSFGPAVMPGFEALRAALPLIQAVRTSSRFGYLSIVAVAVLCGYGVMALRRARWVPPVGRPVLAGALVVACALDPLAAPIGYAPFAGVDPIYQIPRSDPRAVVVELPFPRPEQVYRNAPYMLNATAHWKPILNGYSGFTPPSYAEHFQSLVDFPSAHSIAALAAAGVTHLFVHVDQLAEDSEPRIDRRPELRLLATSGAVKLYRLDVGSTGSRD